MNISINIISVIIPYYNRKTQLSKTLEQFDKLYSNKYQFEVIIVDEAHEIIVVNLGNFLYVYCKCFALDDGLKSAK